MVSDVHLSKGHRSVLPRLTVLMVLMALVISAVPAFALAEPLVLGSSFNSSFNGSKAGWSPGHGVWKLTPSGAYKGVAEEGLFVSAKHKDAYNDFMFKVRMKRVGTGLQGLLVRGDPTNVADDFYAWDSGYGAFFDNTGALAMGEFTGGVLSPLAFGGGAPIVPDRWNTVTVVAYADALGFYMNGALLAVVHDATYGSGSVGIGFMENDATLNHLFVDWARLTVISGDTNPFAADFSTFKVQGDDRVISPFEALGR